MNRVTVEVVQGDIAHQPDIDAIVNAANARLLPGSGVAGAIHGAAGPGLAEECQGLAPIKPGQAVMTGGHGLPNGHVIHCLGPVYGVDQPSGQLLADCFRHALQLADRAGLESIAFPAISTGVFGYPLTEAAAVAAGAIRETIPTLEHIRRIRLVLFTAGDLAAFRAALQDRGLAQA